MLAFDVDAARLYAAIVSRREAAGRPIDTRDAQIEAMCRCHEARLATRNVEDFMAVDVELVNPFDLG